MQHLGPQLSTLSLSFNYFVDSFRLTPPDHGRPVVTWLCLFLSAIPSPLTSLRVDIRADIKQRTLLHLDWALLAQALDGPQFSVLCILRVEIPLVADGEVAVMECLLNMYGRGILEIATAAPESTLDVYTVAADGELFNLFRGAYIGNTAWNLRLTSTFFQILESGGKMSDVTPIFLLAILKAYEVQTEYETHIAVYFGAED
ncbi:hypothetical protein DFH09DRAFT_1332968 [Mycena vulgaris]|nr:hypothetical protein DFH09DRAFT_1332968 [Mycena vulgaris]